MHSPFRLLAVYHADDYSEPQGFYTRHIISLETVYEVPYNTSTPLLLELILYGTTRKARYLPTPFHYFPPPFLRFTPTVQYFHGLPSHLLSRRLSETDLSVLNPLHVSVRSRVPPS